MKTTEEKIAVMQHFARDGAIEATIRGDRLEWFGITHPNWDWSTCIFRIKPEARSAWFLEDIDGNLVHFDSKERAERELRNYPDAYVRIVAFKEVLP